MCICRCEYLLTGLEYLDEDFNSIPPQQSTNSPREGIYLEMLLVG